MQCFFFFFACNSTIFLCMISYLCHWGFITASSGKLYSDCSFKAGPFLLSLWNLIMLVHLVYLFLGICYLLLFSPSYTRNKLEAEPLRRICQLAYVFSVAFRVNPKCKNKHHHIPLLPKCFDDQSIIIMISLVLYNTISATGQYASWLT